MLSMNLNFSQQSPRFSQPDSLSVVWLRNIMERSRGRDEISLSKRALLTNLKRHRFEMTNVIAVNIGFKSGTSKLWVKEPDFRG